VLKIRAYKITENTAGFCDIIDITAKVRQHLEKEKIHNGLATLFVSGSTAALTTIEHEPGLIQDLKEFVEKSFLPIAAIITTIAGATITVFLTCVLPSSGRPWQFRLNRVSSVSAPGSKSSCSTSTTARARVK
jgi:hypothetical protein